MAGVVVVRSNQTGAALELWRTGLSRSRPGGVLDLEGVAKMKLRVNAGYVMIERSKVDFHGLLLPYDKREVSRGKVVGMGTWRNGKGDRIIPRFQTGDVVQFEPCVGYEFNDYLFIPYEYIYGVYADDKR